MCFEFLLFGLQKSRYTGNTPKQAKRSNARYGVQIMTYNRLKFWITCVFWPYITRQTMWKMTMTPRIADPSMKCELVTGEEK